MRFCFFTLVAFLGILFTSCSHKEFKNFPEHTIHTLEFNNSRVPLPSNFIRVGIEDLQFTISESEMEKQEKQRFIDAYNRFKNLDTEPIFFVDSLDIFNSIVFVEAPYVDFSQADLIPYVQLLRDIKKESEKYNGREFEAIDYKYIHQTFGEVMKVKFAIIEGVDTLYQTQHLINRNYRSFSAIVQNRLGLDFYKEMTAIKLDI